MAKAEFVITRTAGGDGSSAQLCGECARREEMLAFGAAGPVGSEICRYLITESASARGIQAGASCLVCGTTLADVVSGGRLGCAACFGRFRDEVERMAIRLHGASAHRGKTPGRARGGRP